LTVGIEYLLLTIERGLNAEAQRAQRKALNLSHGFSRMKHGWERGDARSYELIKKAIDAEWDVFSNGNTTYYDYKK